MHYQRWRKREQNVGPAWPLLGPRPDRCSVDDCTQKVVGRGLCSTHYTRLRKNGTLNTVRVFVENAGRVCSIEDCARPAFCRGWCTLHYGRWRKHGDPRREPPERPKDCLIPGCLERPHGHGYCDRHYHLLLPQPQWERRRDVSAYRRAFYAGVEVEFVVGRRIFERDGWVCQLCGKPIDPDLRGKVPLAQSLDHIIPITLGGSHTYKNVQASHYRCNCIKNARTAE
jgi:5-methylcytosine-specific restriction endonuclease McrA